MSIRKSLLVYKSQHRLFCNKTQSPFTKTDEFIFSVAILGSIAGGGCGGVKGYMDSRIYEKLHIQVYEKKEQYFLDCVIQTTFASVIGMGVGFVSVYLSPIIVPIVTMVTIARYIDPVELPPHPNTTRNVDYWIHCTPQ